MPSRTAQDHSRLNLRITAFQESESSYAACPFPSSLHDKDPQALLSSQDRDSLSYHGIIRGGQCPCTVYD